MGGLRGDLRRGTLGVPYMAQNSLLFDVIFCWWSSQFEEVHF